MKNRTELWKRFRDKTYRHAYADSFLSSYLASQIRVLRQARGLSQKQLAKLAKTKQPRISLLEAADNNSWNIRQLRSLAKVFDVALIVRFESFSSLTSEIERFSRASLERPPFTEDRLITREMMEQELYDVVRKVRGETRPTTWSTWNFVVSSGPADITTGPRGYLPSPAPVDPRLSSNVSIRAQIAK